MSLRTFIGVALLVAAAALAVAGVAGMPARTCSGSFHFVKEHCGSVLHGFGLLFGGFGLGTAGGVVLSFRRRGRAA